MGTIGKEKLRLRESMLVGALLFGLFFGAGNLIFPVELGQDSGNKVIIATIGFLLSGVGLPILGVVASAISNSESLYEVAKPVSKTYALLFTCALYLTIGPFFAIPRTATVAFEVGTRVFIGEGNIKVWLLVFSTLFFAGTLYFSLKPGKIIDSIGKFMTPIFLLLLSVIIVLSIIKPMGSLNMDSAKEAYANNSFSAGLIAGYNTMDALAALAFAIIIIKNIRNLGVRDTKSIAIETLKSGIYCFIAMSLIYSALSYIGSTSVGLVGYMENGGLILSEVSKHYLGMGGRVLLATIVTLACLKTAIGLITACSQMFEEMFPKFLNYKQYAIGFTLLSFAVANLGLSKIISLSVPVLIFLYPQAIILIILSFLYRFINKNTVIYKFTIAFTLIGSLLEVFRTLKIGENSISISKILAFAKSYLPGFKVGFAWILPSLLGFIIGLLVNIIFFYKGKNKKKI